MGLSLVIPFYNEDQNINNVVNGLINALEKNVIDYELVLVNNGSTDASPRMLENLAREKGKGIKVVHVGVNQGYGWGIINGLKQANGQFIGYMCGDGQVEPQSVIELFHCLKGENCDLAKVRRVVRYDGTAREVASAVYNFLFRLMFNVKTKDVNGSPKIWKGELLKALSPVSKDWFIDAEIMIKAKHLNLKVEEVPVEFSRREKGRSHVRFTTVLEFAGNMLSQKLAGRANIWKQNKPKS